MKSLEELNRCIAAARDFGQREAVKAMSNTPRPTVTQFARLLEGAFMAGCLHEPSPPPQETKTADQKRRAREAQARFRAKKTKAEKQARQDQTPMTTPSLLTLQEVAAKLRISLRSARRLVQEKKLGCVRVGRTARIPTQALESYLSRRTEQTSRPFGLREVLKETP